MRHIITFENFQYQEEELNESLKGLLAAGLIALSSLGVYHLDNQEKIDNASKIEYVQTLNKSVEKISDVDAKKLVDAWNKTGGAATNGVGVGMDVIHLRNFTNAHTGAFENPKDAIKHMMKKHPDCFGFSKNGQLVLINSDGTPRTEYKW